MIREADHPDGGRDRHVGTREGDLGHRRADPLGDLQRRGDLGIREKNRELLPAVAPGEVPRPQHAPQYRTDVGQDLVPHGMPALVVDLLEMVEVQEQQPER